MSHPITTFLKVKIIRHIINETMIKKVIAITKKTDLIVTIISFFCYISDISLFNFDFLFMCRIIAVSVTGEIFAKISPVTLESLQFFANFLTMSENTKMSGSPIKPLGDRVVVRPLSEAEMGTMSPSGIIIPETAKKEKPEQGIVVAVGVGKWSEPAERRLPLEVKVGDKVVFSKYGYDEIKVDNQEYFIVSESSILGIFTN